MAEAVFALDPPGKTITTKLQSRLNLLHGRELGVDSDELGGIRSAPPDMQMLAPFGIAPRTPQLSASERRADREATFMALRASPDAASMATADLAVLDALAIVRSEQLEVAVDIAKQHGLDRVPTTETRKCMICDGESPMWCYCHKL